MSRLEYTVSSNSSWSGLLNKTLMCWLSLRMEEHYSSSDLHAVMRYYIPHMAHMDIERDMRSFKRFSYRKGAAIVVQQRALI